MLPSKTVIPDDPLLYDSAFVVIEIAKVVDKLTWNEAGRRRGIQRIKKIIADWEKHD